jgi:hypothetical protein
MVRYTPRGKIKININLKKLPELLILYSVSTKDYLVTIIIMIFSILELSSQRVFLAYFK